MIIAALLIEMLTPAGYMPTMTNGAFLMRPCAGRNAPLVMTRIADAADYAMHGDHPPAPADGDHGQPETSCVFSTLAAPAVAMADPVLLAIAIAAILTAGLHLEEQVTRAHGLHLRPPAQGPPFA